MTDFVTHGELDSAIDAVRDDLKETEDRLRSEFTATLRFEFGRMDTHLDAQDGKLNGVLLLIGTLLITVIGSLIYVASTLL